MASKLFSRILVPHDFSDGAARALEQAVALAAAHGGRMTVQHVIQPFVIAMDVPLGVSSNMIPDAASFIPLQRRGLERLVRRAIGSTKVPYKVRVEVGTPVHAILAAARRASVVVISTHGRTGLGHLLLGSVAERVVQHSPVPVLTMRAPQKRKRR
jgi:nucleotide-binding universal stress UspA family protein